MPAVSRPTIKANGTTSTWYGPTLPSYPRGKSFIANSDNLNPSGYYTFPNPQRTTRPGLPQQTRVPAAP